MATTKGSFPGSSENECGEFTVRFTVNYTHEVTGLQVIPIYPKRLRFVTDLLLLQCSPRKL